jgi:type I restriction enzyme M protein
MRIQTSIKHHDFLMPLAAIKENDWDLSINRYKEMVHEEAVYDAPAVILKRIKLLYDEREVLLSQISTSL